MKIRLFFVALSLFHTVSAQENEKIRLQVRVISSLDGSEIPGAAVKVAYALTENAIPLKTEKRSSFYEVVKGSDVKISAEASRYYTEEKQFETEQLYDQDILEVQLTPKPEEVLTPAPFFVVVRELASGERLEGRIEVTRPSGMTDYIASGNQYQPTEEGEYNFVFQKEGFGSYSQKQHTRPSSEVALLPVTFEVRSVTFSEHEYVLIDAHTKQPVMKTQMFILDENKRPVETLYNSSKGSYLTYRINAAKSYTAEVRADGYEPLTVALANTERSITLELTPADLKRVTLTVRDGYTLQRLNGPQIQIHAPGGTPLALTEEAGELTALLNPRNTYRVQVSADGYAAYTEEISAKGDELEILLRRATYPLALVIGNELNEDQKMQAVATVTQGNGIAVPAVFDPEKKSFLLESDPGEVLQISITVPGFRPYLASNNRKQLAQFQLNVQLEPVKVSEAEVAQAVTEAPATPALPAQEEPVMEARIGNRYALKGVNFEQSQTTMLPGSENKLHEVLRFMKENPQVRIEVIGHTDKTGDERQNVRLSEFRARAVANWLFNQGIDAARISTSGKGSSEPVATNDSEEGKAQNRRIEVMVVNDSK